ncbi:MAG: FixH family protein [Pseudomonadota bacterium]
MIRTALLFCLIANGVLACPATPDALALQAQAEAPSAYITMDPPAISQPRSAQIEFCTDLSMADLSFNAIMPAHQHGMNYEVTVEKIAPGTFDIENIVFHMPGLWEIQVEAISGSTSFPYTAEVMVE